MESIASEKTKKLKNIKHNDKGKSYFYKVWIYFAWRVKSHSPWLMQDCSYLKKEHKDVFIILNK
jgi:hypothetical protein